MILFYNSRKENANLKLIALFGVGLIGTSIRNSIEKSSFESVYHPFCWEIPNQSAKDQEKIFSAIFSILKSVGKTTHCSELCFIWSAGRAGFFATEDQIKAELDVFALVLDLVKKTQKNFPEVKIYFHMLSSAGGLFEGQRLIGTESEPSPRRYYGKLKIEQERKLSSIPGRIAKRIYRPTSVYGFIGTDQRMGLIPTLISNGFKQKVTKINGSLNTLRDYILNDDIGVYIVKNIFSNFENKLEYFLLGSGKPSSIYEIKYFVEKFIGRKIYIEFIETPKTENALDITVNGSSLPSDWSYTSISNGVQYVKNMIITGS